MGVPALTETCVFVCVCVCVLVDGGKRLSDGWVNNGEHNASQPARSAQWRSVYAVRAVRACVHVTARTSNIHLVANSG